MPRDAGSRSTIERLANLRYEDNVLCQGLKTPELPQLQADGVPVVHTPLYSAPLLPPRHRFPMQVFQTIHDHLIDDSVVSAKQVVAPAALPSREMLRQVHGGAYLEAFLAGELPHGMQRRIGLADVLASPVLINRTLWEVAGTMLAADLALEHGLAVSTAGGTHHAAPSAGSGFCIVNDLAVAAATLLATRARVSRVLILDLDVHQGDGTAACFGGTHASRGAGSADSGGSRGGINGDGSAGGVYTCSFHAEKNFPARKAMSTLDVALPDGMQDAAYLQKMHETIPDILRTFKPDLVLYDAGVDPHKDDALGRLALSTQGLLKRDTLVLDWCWNAGIPVAGFVGGGYHHDLATLAVWHSCLHRAAAECWHKL